MGIQFPSDKDLYTGREITVFAWGVSDSEVDKSKIRSTVIRLQNDGVITKVLGGRCVKIPGTKTVVRLFSVRNHERYRGSFEVFKHLVETSRTREFEIDS